MADTHKYVDLPLTPQQMKAPQKVKTAPVYEDVPIGEKDLVQAAARQEPEGVTLGDLKADPLAALGKIGGILKKDLSDPRTWLTAAALYFGPKAIGAVTGPVRQAMVTAGRARFSPKQAFENFELNKPQSILKGAYLKPTTPEKTVPGYQRY